MSENLDNLSFTALVLVLAKQIKAEKAAKGTSSTSDYTYEAVQLIKDKHREITSLLR